MIVYPRFSTVVTHVKANPSVQFNIGIVCSVTGECYINSVRICLGHGHVSPEQFNTCKARVLCKPSIVVHREIQSNICTLVKFCNANRRFEMHGVHYRIIIRFERNGHTFIRKNFSPGIASICRSVQSQICCGKNYIGLKGME